MAAFLFWFVIVNVSALALFGILLIHDRIKYGVWADKIEDDI